jgi:hypothetical protein
MAAEDVARIYMQLDESDAIRLSVARGDFEAFGVPSLTDSEKKMLVDAASEELPDVTGYNFGPEQQLTVWAPYRFVTEQYVTRFTKDPATQSRFLSWRNSAGVSPDG